MKADWMKIVTPVVLIGYCPQCKKVIKEYEENVTVQTVFEDDISHRTESFENRDHTPFLMTRVVV